jgi:hypothetical protein
LSDISRLKITNDGGAAWKTKITVDDQDVSNCFSGYRITGAVGEAVKVELDVVVAEIDFEGTKELRMPFAGTRELLIRHGWTPPAQAITEDVPPVDLDESLAESLDELAAKVRRHGAEAFSVHRSAETDDAVNPNGWADRVPTGRQRVALNLIIDETAVRAT